MSSRRLLLAAGLLLFMAGCQTDSAEIAGTSEPDTTVGAAGVATTMPESPTPRANESSSSNGELIQHGAMHEVIGQQKHHGRILLAEAIKRPNLFAVGALEGLEGEITVYDGKVLATEVAEGARMRPIADAEKRHAALLVGSHVSEWSDHTLDKTISAEQLDAYIESAAADAGLDLSKPFVFTIRGAFQNLQWHVINGACPVHAERAGIELPKDKSPAKVTYKEATGTLVGVFAKNAAGRITHPGTSLHTHAIVELNVGLDNIQFTSELTGHVESVGVKAGAVLRLPRLMQP
jgi:alpha-acetolactate decarboxylase